MAHPTLGFETIGNATMIAYDRGLPVLVTDPWISGAAYFGSWSLSHEIPAEQREAIVHSKYVWVSHGHPDHLSGQSLELVRSSTILVPDHFGGRIAEGLRAEGFQVRVLEDQVWTRLTDDIQVFCHATESQDAILLVAFRNQTVVINTNDTGNSGWTGMVRAETRRFAHRLVLACSGYGDICGINFYKEDGEKLLSPCELRKQSGYQVGRANSKLTALLGGTHFVPFSSMHVYQRTDSIWANEYLTEFSDYENGYDTSASTLLPPHLSYDCESHEWQALHPVRLEPAPLPPETFGDNWADVLDRADQRMVDGYFRRIEHLPRLLDFVRVRVGGQETVIELTARHFERGITLEVPRGALMAAVQHEIYEDLTLSNFVRVTLHGGFSMDDHNAGLLSHVARYSDNARVKNADELDDYHAHYRRRLGYFNFLRHHVEQTIIESVNRSGLNHSPLYDFGKRLYLSLAS